MSKVTEWGAGTKTSDHIEVLHKLQKLKVYVACDRFLLLFYECLWFTTRAVTVIKKNKCAFENSGTMIKIILNVYYV